MPEPLLPPDIRRMIPRLDQRVQVLERRVKPKEPPFSARMPYVVVRDDDLGDYTSIKTAIEETPAGTVRQIWVRAGTYNDAGAGRVTVPSGARVTVTATAPHGEPILITEDATRETHQVWACDGFTAVATTTQWLSLVGFDINTSSGQVVGDLAADVYLRLSFENCGLSGTGNLYGSGSARLALDLVDVGLTPKYSLGGKDLPITRAVRTSFYTFSDGTGIANIGSPSGSGTTPMVAFADCHVHIPVSAVVTWKGNGSVGSFMMDNCTVGRTNAAKWAFDELADLFISNTRFYPAVELTGRSGLDWHLVNCYTGTLSVTNYSGAGVHSPQPCTISGVYGTLSLDRTSYGAGILALVTLTGSLSISGSGNFVLAEFHRTGTATVTFAAGSANNTVLATTGGTFSVTDSGTNNRFNSFPPSGAAGGDLGGTYPNPTVPNLIPKTLFDAKGDLIAASAADTAARLAVGTDGLFLKADSTQSTGLVWSAAGGIPETIIDAKGDLIVGSAADMAVRLAVGSNDQVLIADSTATNGIRWGSAGAAVDQMVPYYLGTGETFTVATHRQALYVEPIELDGGTLDLSGLLIEVEQSPDLSALVHMGAI